MGEFLCSHLILKMEKICDIFGILYALLFLKGKNATEYKKIFVQCMEKLLWLIECVKSSLQSFMVEISPWMMLHGQADQLKLKAIKYRHWGQSTLYHMVDSQHTQNIQTNKVIGENEKCVFYFMEKKHTDFWPTQY